MFTLFLYLSGVATMLLALSALLDNPTVRFEHGLTFDRTRGETVVVLGLSVVWFVVIPIALGSLALGALRGKLK